MQIPEGCEKNAPPPLFFFTYVRTPLQHLLWEKSFFLSIFFPHPSFSKTYLEEQKFLPKQCKQHWRKVVIKRVLKEGRGEGRIASNVSSVSGVWVEAERALSHLQFPTASSARITDRTMMNASLAFAGNNYHPCDLSKWFFN